VGFHELTAGVCLVQTALHLQVAPHLPSPLSLFFPSTTQCTSRIGLSTSLVLIIGFLVQGHAPSPTFLTLHLQGCGVRMEA